jgi:hypothetical protein
MKYKNNKYYKKLAMKLLLRVLHGLNNNKVS